MKVELLERWLTLLLWNKPTFGQGGEKLCAGIRPRAAAAYAASERARKKKRCRSTSERTSERGSEGGGSEIRHQSQVRFCQMTRWQIAREGQEVSRRDRAFRLV